MASGIESVTVAVGDLESGLRIFRDQIGLSVVYEARASVGLLEAWRYPVHESVRLVELASGAAALGRIRLVHFEEAGLTVQTAAGNGPKAIDFRMGAPAVEDASVTSGPGGLPLLLPSSPPAREPLRSGAAGASATDSTPVSAVWINASDPAAGRFYAEVLGLTPAAPAVWPPGKPSDAVRMAVGIPPAAPARITTYRSGSQICGAVVVAHVPDAVESAGEPAAVDPPRVGHPGINLLTCRCDDLDEVVKRLQALALEPLTPPTHVGLPSGCPGRVMVVRGPSREIFELVELSD